MELPSAAIRYIICAVKSTMCCVHRWTETRARILLLYFSNKNLVRCSHKLTFMAATVCSLDISVLITRNTTRKSKNKLDYVTASWEHLYQQFNRSCTISTRFPAKFRRKFVFLINHNLWTMSSQSAVLNSWEQEKSLGNNCRWRPGL